MAWNEPGPGRDPWNFPPGGNRGGDKPPDLNVILRRLRALFGGGGSGGGHRSSQQNGLAIIGLFALAAWLGSGMYSVDEQEKGVVLRFGAYARTVDSGVRWHLPRPIEHVVRVNVTRARTASSRATVLTKDENLVDVELNVQYRVSSPEEYLFGAANNPDDTLQKSLTSALREVVGVTSMTAVLNDGRQVVADAVKRRLQERLDSYKSGLLVTEVNLQNAKLPDEVKAAFDDVIKAREEERRLKDDAEAYADDRLPRARADAARQLAEAESYRAQSVSRAEGDTARFNALLNEYKHAPEVTRDRLYIDAMSAILSQSGKVLVDVDKGNPTIYVPLEQLLKNAGHAPAAGDDNAPGAPPPLRSSVTPTPGSNGNDSYRSRERESH